MWDPQTYTDTDYGLDDGESFEPGAGWESEPFDTSLPHIMTVLGPIDPDELGICQVHEHLLANPAALTGDDPTYLLERIDFASEEIGFFLTAGGVSMVEASTPDYGRDLAGLVAIAQRVPIHIIASGGRQGHEHASLMQGALNQAALAGELRAELGARHRPGILAFGTSGNQVTPEERVAAEAVATVASEHGYPVYAGLEGGMVALEVLALIESNGFPANRTIIGHLDRTVNVDLLTAIAQRGAWLAFDRIGKAGGAADDAYAGILVSLAEAGFADQLLISQGLNRTTEFLVHGGQPGWIHLIERFSLMLMEAGADAMLVRKLLMDNPARALVIRPGGQQ